MKQGFTLMELIIVMVIVGILVVVALPQYQRSAERGRSLVGLANVRSVADRLNAYYILHDTYPSESEFNDLKFDLTKDSLFANPSYVDVGKVEIVRNPNSGWNYKFRVDLSIGEIQKILCQNTSETEDVCEELGLEGNLDEPED